MLEPEGLRKIPLCQIRHSDPLKCPPRDVNVRIVDDNDSDSASTVSVE